MKFFWGSIFETLPGSVKQKKKRGGNWVRYQKKAPEIRTRWVLKLKPAQHGFKPPPAINVKMSKPGPGGSLQKEDPDKTGGYHIYRPTVLSRRSHSSFACAGFQGQTEFSELALSERCVALRRPHPLALVACVCVAGWHPFIAPSCRSFRQLCPSLEKPRPGIPFDVVVNVSGGCLFAWFFVFFFLLILHQVYIGGGRKEGRKEGKKYALSLLSLRLWKFAVKNCRRW
jgi:hypothetical protein